MQNIEIKARYEDLKKGEQVCKVIEARFENSYHQIDTYFRVKKGRLKLRQIDAGTNQLIYYQRPDVDQPKMSDYHIYAVADPDLLKAMLDGALGVWKVIDKQREVYWFDEVRIHLDRVAGLGNFLEFEGVLAENSPPEPTRKKVDELLLSFEIPARDLIDVSYSDLL